MSLNFHNDLISIDTWLADPTYDGMFPKGAREKAVYFSPAKPVQDCIKPDWRYLFKLPRSTEWCPWQFWVEVIAYRLGYLIGVPVPPTYVAISCSYQPGRETYGALIEWFYDERTDVYIEGGHLMAQVIEDYDRAKGEKHNWQAVYGLNKNFKNGLAHWAGIITLDSLIGNVDRHQDNWGWVLKNARADRDVEICPAPAFDNGTALGYGIRAEDFVKYQDSEKMAQYLTNPKNAHHHMKWSLEEPGPINFCSFVEKMIVQSPEIKPIIQRHLSFSRQQAEDILSPLLKIVTDQTHRLRPERLDFMLDLIVKRQTLLKETLAQCDK